MNRLVGWFAGNPVAANLLMAFILVAGGLSLPSLRQETFPNVAFDFVSVTVVYPGAAPDEVEEAVCVRIEEAIHGVKEVDRIYARATEGFGAVWARVPIGADPSRALDQIRARVDALDTLPADAERPVVQELVDDSVLLGVAIHGEGGDAALRRIGERVRDEITALPEVTRAELVGVRPYEIAIEVSEAALRRHGLSFDVVAAAVASSSVELPGGALKTDAGEILVRAQGRAYRGREFEDVVVLTREDGSRVRLGDVASVADGFEESPERIRFDGEPAVMVRLLTSERRNVLDLSRAVRRYVEQAEATLPPGVGISLWADESVDFRSRRDLLLSNGWQGLALILVVLALFMRARLAFWVSAGIPIAFLGAFIALALLDVSINMMSLFAFLVALGLVVDDAIIVGESVARHRARGGDPLEAAIAGVREVAMPVTIAVATTALFIAPSLALPTSMGKIAYSLAVVTIACLAFSWIEALFVLPAHLARAEPSRPADSGPLRWLQRRFESGLETIARHYRPLATRVVRRPGVTLALGVSIFAVSVGAVAGDWVRWSFFPHIETEQVSARVVLPSGAPPAAVDAAVARLEGAANALGETLEHETGADVFEHVLIAVGDRPDRHDDFQNGGDPPNVAHVMIQLVPGERRTTSSFEVKDRWRALVGEVPGALSVVYRGGMFETSRPIDVSISGIEPAALARAANEVERALASIPGVREIANSQTGGKRELRLRVRPEGESLGLTLAELARQVRQGFHGEEVQRIQRGRDDVAVIVRYPAAERRSLRDLERMRVRIPEHGEVAFAAVARAERAEGYASVERRDLARNISVTADVDLALTRPSAVATELAESAFPEIAARYPGLVLDLDGRSRDEGEMMSRLKRDWVIALLAAYVLLAVPLRSYTQPLVVLAAVPFGFAGAAAGHALLGLELSAFSMIGFVALTGVVINDALLLVDSANRMRKQGLGLDAALVEAGALRLRPILLTSITTFLGLLPLLFERSGQSLWLKPMAAALGFGVLGATGVTLLLVPAANVGLERLFAGVRRVATAELPGRLSALRWIRPAA